MVNLYRASLFRLAGFVRRTAHRLVEARVRSVNDDHGGTRRGGADLPNVKNRRPRADVRTLVWFRNDLRVADNPALFHAIADAQLVVATTSSRGRTVAADFTPVSMARRFAQLGPAETMALVFGREDSGLTGEEMMLCQRTAVIPTNERFPTMNLAQSVGTFCYELSSIDRAAPVRQLAPAGQVERLHDRLEALLVEAGFLDTNNPDRIYEDLRAIFARAELDEREVTILLGMVRQLEWAVRR